MGEEGFRFQAQDPGHLNQYENQTLLDFLEIDKW